jgi:hypothetical protein
MMNLLKLGTIASYAERERRFAFYEGAVMPIALHFAS